MPGTPTPKHGLATVDGAADFVHDFPPVFNANQATLDDLMATAITTMPRPAAGKSGRFHRATDGTLSFDTGAAWLGIPVVPDAWNWRIRQDGVFEWSASGAGVADTSVFRASAGVLRTPGVLQADGGFTLGPAADTNLYRGAANQLKTDSAFVVSGALFVDGIGLGVKAFFGAAADTNLYRGGADVLKTDDAFRAVLDVRARDAAASQSAIGALGPGAEAALALGVGADAVIYRAGALALATSSSLAAAGGYSLGAPLSAVPAYQAQQVAAQTLIRNKLLAADTFPAFRILGDGKQEWGAGAAAAVDTNLYRSAADTLKTDDALQVVLDLSARQGTGPQVIVGQALAGIPGVLFGAAGDTNLYRSAADVLKTDDSFSVGPVVSNGAGASIGVWLDPTGKVNAIRSAVGVPILFGSVAADTNARVSLSSDGVLSLGPGNAVADTNLYRSSADVLRTDDSLVVAIDIYARGGVATQVAAGDISVLGVGGAARAGLVFGSSADTNLYRSAADTLKTDDSLVVAGSLTVGGKAVAPVGRFAARWSAAAPTLATGAAVPFDTEDYDADGVFDNTTGRINIPAGQVWMVHWRVHSSTLGAYALTADLSVQSGAGGTSRRGSKGMGNATNAPASIGSAIIPGGAAVHHIVVTHDQGGAITISNGGTGFDTFIFGYRVG